VPACYNKEIKNFDDLGTIMTIGIYRLLFNGTTKCYVGQSINIEHRFRTHISSLLANTANIKMLEAYNSFGTPILDILCECTQNELTGMELEAISIFDCVNNGFNIISTATPNSSGEMHPRCIYSNEQILEVAKLLSDTANKAKDISDKTGVSFYVVQDIANLKTHGWIKEHNPIIYDKLVSLRGTRKNPKTIQDRGIQYPLVRSPSNTTHKITNLKKFCEEHNVDRSNFRRMLNGSYKSCQGWKVDIHG
jgi:hypothetical protein